MDLSQKVALVTGAGTGIGKGIAIELAKLGAKVAIHYNSSDKGALDTLKQIKAFNGDATIVQANVANKNEIENMVKEVVNHYGRLDILVNNAALQLNVELFDYDEDNYDRMMHINLKGYWQCIQAVLPYMKQRKSGRIINISSVHGKRPTDFDPVYSMTKGGIKMLVRESAIELAKYGITVNMIEPGAVDVGKFKTLPKPNTPEEKHEYEKVMRNRLRKFPLGRIGQPRDVAHMVCYIASDQTDFMTGASIRLDGASMLL